MKEKIITIQDAISKGNTEEAIALLRQLMVHKGINDDRLDTLIIQSSNINITKKEIRNGTIDYNQKSININRINATILDLVNELSKTDEPHDNFSKINKNRNYKIIFPIIIFSVIALILCVSQFLSPKNEFVQPIPNQMTINTEPISEQTNVLLEKVDSRETNKPQIISKNPASNSNLQNHKQVPINIDELIIVLEKRASVINNTMKAQKKEINLKFLDEFNSLHKLHIESLMNEDFILAHEILRKIYNLLNELKIRQVTTGNAVADNSINYHKEVPSPVEMMLREFALESYIVEKNAFVNSLDSNLVAINNSSIEKKSIVENFYRSLLKSGSSK